MYAASTSVCQWEGGVHTLSDKNLKITFFPFLSGDFDFGQLLVGQNGLPTSRESISL